METASGAVNGHDKPPAGDAQPPAKRSKKGKKKIQGQPSAEDYLKVTPLPRNADVLEEESKPVQLSKVEKASQMVLSEDGMSVTSQKGYRMVRATRGVHKGTWYFEIIIVHLGATGHCRLGWSTKKGELQAPVGYDEHSIGYRDLEGSKVHKALREEYGAPYSEGDVIGCFIHMPEGGRTMEQSKADILVWKNTLVLPEEPEKEAATLEGSLVGFSRNGEFQGIAYRDFKEGTYYPAASLYTLPEQAEGATVAFNFGPDFRYPAPTVEGCPAARPVADLALQLDEEEGDKEVPMHDAAATDGVAEGRENGSQAEAPPPTSAGTANAAPE